MREIEKGWMKTKNPPSTSEGGLIISNLLHQQHLPSPLDRTVQLTLIMRRQSRVFTGKNAPLVGDELFEQIDVLEIQSVKSKIDFRLWARRPCF